MIFSHVKISSFRAKAHLVFHWCLYNKSCYLLIAHQSYSDKWKKTSVSSPHPLGNCLILDPSSPRNSVALRGGWGVWIFSGTTHFVILYSSDSLLAILISTNSDDDLDAENVSTLLTTVVQAVDGAIHQINHQPADTYHSKTKRKFEQKSNPSIQHGYSLRSRRQKG